MRFTRLNAATQQLEPIELRGDTLFVEVQVHEPYGDALVDSGRCVLIGLDNLVGLVAARLAILEAADDEAPKAKRKPVAA